jgi:membrane-bound ClpP family serine protease
VVSKATRSPVLRRYVLFQLPELLAGGLVLLLLVRMDYLSSGLAWLLFAGWVLKEIVLFPILRIAYEPSNPIGGEALVGAIGRVAVPATAAAGSPGFSEDRGGVWKGRVQIGPELWNARLAPGSQPVSLGSAVRVEAVEGLTLIVSAVESVRE